VSATPASEKPDAVRTFSPAGFGLLLRHLCRQLVDHVRTPLHRDGYALALNSAFTSASGVIYWILATRAYSAHSVGLNAALISSMMFLAGIASVNLPNILVRFLPESGGRTRQHVIWSYGLATTFGLCVAAVFIVGIGAWAPSLRFLDSDRSLQVWFAFSTLAWCLFNIQDSVLTALGRAVWVPVENAVFSLLKIGLLAAFVVAMPVYGIFVSWTLAMLVSVIGVNAIIFGRLLRRPTERTREARTGIRSRAFARYFAADYVCSVTWMAAPSLLPVVVTAVAGATTNAYFALPYAVALPFYLFAQNIATSLLLHGAIDPAELPNLTRKAVVQGARVLIPAVTLLVALAPLVLSVFGKHYAEHSTTVLRLLALGALPCFVMALAVSVARVRRRMRRAVLACSSEAVLALAVAAPLIHVAGVVGAGVAWTGAQCLVALVLLMTWRNTLPRRTAAAAPARWDGAAGRGTGLAPSPVRPWRLKSPSAASQLHPVLRRLFAQLEQRGLLWTLVRMPSNSAMPTGDVDLLVAPADAVAFRETAAASGFVALPGWRSPPQMILLRYDQPTDHWLVLDVSTCVSFRSPHNWCFPQAAEAVLRDRQVHDGIAVPADGDAFWLLLLHCLLDKGAIPAHYQTRLWFLASAATESPLGPAIASAAGDDFHPDDLMRAVRAGNWEALCTLGRRLALELRRRRSVRDRTRAWISGVVRTARKPFLMPRRRGLNLALLGPNGVGKSTAAAGLQQSWPFDSRVLYMGIWKGLDAAPPGMSRAVEVLARPVRIWLRYLRAQYHQLRGRLVVFDRYVYEALLPPKPPLVALKRSYFWLLSHLVPRPRAVVVLDVPGEIAYARKHENPPDELEYERKIYAQLGTRLPTFEVVDASEDADAVRAAITTILWRELTARWGGSSVRS
jgi:O-antigen/teichoic acid export membrane protein